MAEKVKLTEAQKRELASFAQRLIAQPYATFPPGPERDALRHLGCIERWNPTLKATGRVKPWRITEAGRAALEGAP